MKDECQLINTQRCSINYTQKCIKTVQKNKQNPCIFQFIRSLPQRALTLTLVILLLSGIRRWSGGRRRSAPGQRDAHCGRQVVVVQVAQVGGGGPGRRRPREARVPESGEAKQGKATAYSHRWPCRCGGDHQADRRETASTDQ